MTLSRFPRVRRSIAMGRHLVASAAAISLLAGCASIPTSGPVRVQPRASATAQSDNVVALVRPPEPGASPTAIVSGFVQANADATLDYAVARSYLAPEVSDSWSPSAGVRIVDDSNGLDLRRRGSRVTLRVPQEAVLSAEGLYSAVASGTEVVTDFTVRKVDGQWRIDGVRDGLIVSLADIARTYRTADRYFLNASRQYLVPDRSLVPTERRGYLTTLVRGVLSGPSSWLAPAVGTAVPRGTRLNVDAVLVSDDTATVDLTAQALAATAKARRLMAAQIVYTATSSGEVNAVRITVTGQPLLLDGLGPVLTRADFASLDSVAALGTAVGYVVKAQSLQRIVGAGIEPVAGSLGSGQVPVGRAEVSWNGRFAAVTLAARGAGNTVAIADLTTGADVLPLRGIDARESLAWGPDSRLWAVGNDGQVQVWSKRTGAQSVSVRVGGTVTVVIPSFDGARAIVVASGRAYVMRVKSANGRLTLAAPRLLQSGLGPVRSVAWADAQRVQLLSQPSGESTQVFELLVGAAAVSSLGGVPRMTRVASAPSQAILVEAADGVWENAGVGWRLAVKNGTSPSYGGPTGG